MSCPRCNDTGVVETLGGIAKDGTFSIYCTCDAGRPKTPPPLPVVPPTDDIVRE